MQQPSSQPSKVAVLVPPRCHRLETGTGERGTERLVLFATDLDEEPTTPPKDASGPDHDAS